MQRNIQKNGAVNLFALLLVGVATFAVSRYANALAGLVTTAFLGLGMLVAAVSWFQIRLEERERLEKLEFDEVTRSRAGSSTLFNTQDVEAFPAQRSREQFEKFFVPGFTILLLVLQAGGFWWLWRRLSKIGVEPLLNQPLMAMAILGLLALVMFLLGQYSAGLARLEKHRLLNPSASYLLLGAYLLALDVAALAAILSGVRHVDLYVARSLCWLLALLALENLLALLLEIYRPRVRGRVAHLLYDSRLVGLISHPEGIFTTAAHALDYQFGFKVSETWFFQFLQRSILWLALFQLAILLAWTGFVYIQPGEEALLERFGQPMAGREILGPGFHFKYPWPIERTHRYRTQEIQSFNVGLEHEEKEEEAGAVLWTVTHSKEEFNLLVASREPLDAGTNAAGKKAPPVNLLSVGIPVQYQISDLNAWAYNYSDAGELLKEIATREVVRYLVGVDMIELMSTARFTAGEELRKRIQVRADELKLGAKIVFVGLQDVHPPVKVGAAYERYVGARQKRQAAIRQAEAYAIRTNSQASAEALRRELQASAESVRRVANALATESLFTNQMAAFHASPEVYAQRSYLQTLARNGANARKFIVLFPTNSPETLQLNMEDKIRDDILNVPLPAPRTK
jgi:regulator of protease activity HflC (stomatin/prohibitin superfamily)